jgi:hypothetical protein
MNKIGGKTQQTLVYCEKDARLQLPAAGCSRRKIWNYIQKGGGG